MRKYFVQSGQFLSLRRFASSTSAKKFKIVTCEEDPSLEPAMHEVMVKNWPAFFLNARTGNQSLPFRWELLYEYFPQFQFAVIDEESNVIAATGHACPNYWDKPDLRQVLHGEYRLRRRCSEKRLLSQTVYGVTP